MYKLKWKSRWSGLDCIEEYETLAEALCEFMSIILEQESKASLTYKPKKDK